MFLNCVCVCICCVHEWFLKKVYEFKSDFWIKCNDTDFILVAYLQYTMFSLLQTKEPEKQGYQFLLGNSLWPTVDAACYCCVQYVAYSLPPVHVTQMKVTVQSHLYRAAQEPLTAVSCDKPLYDASHFTHTLLGPCGLVQLNGKHMTLCGCIVSCSK